MNVSYDYYKIFYNVAKYRSFTRAAEVMYSNQPNLTRAVKSLENQLGCALFERTNKGVRLTAEGQELYEHISAAIKHIEAGESTLAMRNSAENGIVSIGATEIALRCYLLPILGDFHKRYPGIRIKIMNVSTPQAIKMVENRLVDLAVVTAPIEERKGIRTENLSELNEVPVISRELDFNGSGELSEICGHPIISLGNGTATYQFYFDLFLEKGLRFAPDIEAATADQILPLVKCGLGIGFVPPSFLENESGIKEIPLNEPIPARDIILVKKTGHSLPLPAKELQNMICNK